MSSGPDPSATPGGEFKSASFNTGPPNSAAAPLSAEDLITLNEEIAAMAKAGLPLDQGLTMLAGEMGESWLSLLLPWNWLRGLTILASFVLAPGLGRMGFTMAARKMTGERLQEVTKSLAADLRAGFTLPQALKRQEGVIPPYYASLLAAGIRSWRIGEVLGAMTLYARSMADFRDTTISALLYPGIILLLGIGLIFFVGALILPKFEQIFADFKMKLPLITEFLILVGRNWFSIFVVPTVVLLVGIVLLRLCLRFSTRGRVLWARLLYAIPLVGTLVRSARLAAFTDLLGILVDQSIPLPEALRLAAEASSDPLVTAGAGRIENDLRQGVPLGTALKKQRLVPELVVWMVHFGEKQGTLGASLHQLADLYRRKMEVRAALMRTLLPPLLILVLALTLGVLFIFGLMAPLFSLLEGLSGGGK